MHPPHADIDLYIGMTVYILICVYKPTHEFVYIYTCNYHLQATPMPAS